MSELKLVSPLLDGFEMGEPISDRNGVRCCPAMKENSDDKYIVKIISIPASQRQLDALLLTGAYRDANAAAEYFKQLAEDTVKDARLLQQLSRLEGFLSYESWQIVPKDNNETGFDVYLLGSYKRSLEKHMRRNTMTHLGAVNLGIDLCTALSLCRRAGFIYTNLKPGNVFISDQREYRIGDLGFAKLSAMKYTSMPGSSISRFTPPELHDPLATLNPTVDTYGLGMILYMIYNNGHIPFEGKAPMMVLPAPLNADYEIAEIILKACDPNPRKRYQTPVEMGKALVNYMQRNRINDVPIVPPGVDPMAAAASMAPPAAAMKKPVDPAAPAESAADQPEDDLLFLDGLLTDDTAPGSHAEDDAMAVPVTEEANSMLSQADALMMPDPDPEPEADLVVDFATAEEADDMDMDVDFDVAEEADPMDMDVDFGSDEDAEAMVLDTSSPEEAALTDIDEVSPTSAEAAPDPEVDPGFDAFLGAFPTVSVDDGDDEDDDGDDDDEDEDPAEKVSGFNLPIGSKPAFFPEENEDFFADTTPPRKKRGWVGLLVTLLILGLLCGGGYYYYANYYLLSIDNLTIEGYEDSLSVQVSTAADASLLQIVCTDTYGNKQTKHLSGGSAVFTDLNPDTMYKITVEAEGFHALTGSVSGSYTTAEETRIVDFTVKGGIANGSAILNFTVDGPETGKWVVSYTAEGEQPQALSFTGHMVTIDELTVGKLYTFTLSQEISVDLYLTGKTSLEYLASNVIVAEGLSIVSCVDGVLTTTWSAPEEATVDSWSVRCYSDSGYDETVVVSEPTAQFSNISADTAYTVEVTAAGMSQSARAFVTANPSTVTDVAVNYTPGTGMTLTWNSAGTPTGGWLVMYSLDDSETTEMAVCTGNTATVKTVIPNAVYNFRIMAADGSTVFGGTASHPGIEQTKFNQYGLSADQIQASLCPTPKVENWTHEDVKEDAYTTSYAPGESASLVLYTSARFYLKSEPTTVTFVIRDTQGKVIPNLMRSREAVWRDLWPGVGKYCYLDVPVLPAEVGEYTLEVYFNGATALTKPFSIISGIG